MNNSGLFVQKKVENTQAGTKDKNTILIKKSVLYLTVMTTYQLMVCRDVVIVRFRHHSFVSDPLVKGNHP